METKNNPDISIRRLVELHIVTLHSVTCLLIQNTSAPNPFSDNELFIVAYHIKKIWKDQFPELEASGRVKTTQRLARRGEVFPFPHRLHTAARLVGPPSVLPELVNHTCGSNFPELTGAGSGHSAEIPWSVDVSYAQMNSPYPVPLPPSSGPSRGFLFRVPSSSTTHPTTACLEFGGLMNWPSSPLHESSSTWPLGLESEEEMELARSVVQSALTFDADLTSTSLYRRCWILSVYLTSCAGGSTASTGGDQPQAAPGMKKTGEINWEASGWFLSYLPLRSDSRDFSDWLGKSACPYIGV
ncbi:hypothetical protein C8J57DRAFT_1230445 [Mycena rebaudengoi]|nr:hypothetical protein C8J57DRAFT_1230445 [Mycena rebaudengoi]